MKFTIICSTLDKASMNIKSKLLENFNFDKKDSITLNGHDVNIHTIDSESIHFEEAEKKIDTNFFIFASKHQSKSGEKTLSVHFPGNFHTNDYGGQKNKMCGTSSGFLKESFINLNKLNTLSEFKVTLEATHHGPYIKKPCIFIALKIHR